MDHLKFWLGGQNVSLALYDITLWGYIISSMIIGFLFYLCYWKKKHNTDSLDDFGGCNCDTEEYIAPLINTRVVCEPKLQFRGGLEINAPSAKCEKVYLASRYRP